MPKLFLSFCLVVLLAGCGSGSNQDILTLDSSQISSGGPITVPSEDPELVICTEEAKICPDGSAVGRVAPNCEFAACNPTSMNKLTEIKLADVPTGDCKNKDDEQQNCPGVGETIAKMTTPQGDIWIKFFPSLTPKTFENFVGLSERGFYDGLIFHRVIPDFMIQGGDPLGNGTGGESIWGGAFEDEFTAKLKNIKGSLAMANRGPATNTSQFFINQADNNFLDSRHTVFGQVISGLSIVTEIANLDRNSSDKPNKDVTMKVEVFEIAE